MKFFLEVAFTCTVHSFRYGTIIIIMISCCAWDSTPVPDALVCLGRQRAFFSESSTSTRCRLDVFSGNGCLKLIVWFHADFTMAGKSRITIATEANILTHTCCNLPGHMLKFTSHWSCPERRGGEKKIPTHTHKHSQGTGNTTVLSLVLSLCFFIYILAHILIPRKQRFALFAFELNFPRAS